MATKIDGITIDTRELDRIKANLRPRAERIVKESAFGVETVAKIVCPKDTHNLKNNIGARQVGQFSWLVEDGTEYGVYQELGFHHWRSGQFIQNPFMVPAVEKERPIFERNWGRLFE